MRGPRLRVLVVDDTPIVRAVVRRALEADIRFEVVGEATNGREGVAAANALQPDLVLLDLAMPEMDGLEALPHIRGACEWARVVVLSAFSPDQMASSALAAGASAYIEKTRLATDLVPHLVALFEAVHLS